MGQKAKSQYPQPASIVSGNEYIVGQVVLATVTPKNAGQLRALMHTAGCQPAIGEGFNYVHGIMCAMFMAILAQLSLQNLDISSGQGR